jgi:hypothetical protein
MVSDMVFVSPNITQVSVSEPKCITENICQRRGVRSLVPSLSSHVLASSPVRLNLFRHHTGYERRESEVDFYLKFQYTVIIRGN